MNAKQHDIITRRYQRGTDLDLPAAVAEAWEWQLNARCRGLPIEQFFPPLGLSGHSRRQVERAAKQVCAGCPVLVSCREHALAAREPFGVWGGLSAHDRALRASDPAATPTEVSQRA